MRNLSQIAFNLASVLSLVFCAFSTEGVAASFDCAKASSKMEKAICASPSISTLDGDLGKLYQDAVSRSPESMRQDLREEQRRWLREVRNACVDDACLQKAYTDRVSVLQKAKEEYEALKAEVEGEDKRQAAAMQAPKAEVPVKQAAATAPPPVPATPPEQQPTSQPSESEASKRAQLLYVEAKRLLPTSTWVSTGLDDRDWGYIDISSNVMPAHTENGSMFVALLYRKKQTNGISINYINVVEAATCSPDILTGVAWLYAIQEHFPDRFEGSGGFDKKNVNGDFNKFGILSCTTLVKLTPALAKKMQGAGR